MREEFENLIEQRKLKGIDPVFTISNDFVIGLQLGQGAFATVYKSTHKQTGYEVALKTYEKKLLTHRSQLMAIHREIYILAGLQHPNIMKLFEVLDQTSKCHLVMELCHGRNLHHFIKKKPGKCLTEQEAIPVFRQIVSAVAYMHEHGLVHRDLKLENILISETGGVNEIKLIDFGFATNCQAGHKLSLFCGTPCYMDPDLVKQRKYSGQGVDVWALGVILFLLVTGGVPFWGDNEAELFRRIGAAKYSLPVKGRTYSKNIRSLFAKIFQTNASKRISASEILTDPWLGKGAAPQKSNTMKRPKPVPKAEIPKAEEDKDNDSTHK